MFLSPIRGLRSLRPACFASGVESPSQPRLALCYTACNSCLMTLAFVEFPAFTRRLLELANDEVLRDLQNELMQRPDKGAVMQGTGGFRKVRMALPGRGKRSGARVIYLRVPEAETIVLVTLYTKSGKADLTSAERSTLRSIAAQIKLELL
jgi:hypothetical protein